MEAILTQVMNGLDKGGAYALIALGLTLIFGTLGVVNFAHGALFMIGAFVAVSVNYVLTLKEVSPHPTELTPWGEPLMVETPYATKWFGDLGPVLIDYSVPIAILVSIPIMLFIGFMMERGLIRHFYKRPHSEQILVTFGLAIVLQEIIKKMYGATSVSIAAPDAFKGTVTFFENTYVNEETGRELTRSVSYGIWRLVYFFFSLTVIAAVMAFLRFTTFGMVVRAGMADRETVQLLGINIRKRFTIVFSLAILVTGLAGVMYAPIEAPTYEFGANFLVLSFVVVVVGGMGSIGGAVVAGFLLGILQSLASLTEVKAIFPGIDQIILYLIAVIVLLVRPRGLMGRKGVMET